MAHFTVGTGRVYRSESITQAQERYYEQTSQQQGQPPQSQAPLPGQQEGG